MTYIQLKGIRKSFGNKEVIKNLDLNINKGEFVSLLGPSGCGKTTILRMLAGFIEPDGGEIVIDNKTVFSAENKINIKTGQRNLGMVFQSYAVWPHMNVFDNVAYPLKIKKYPREEIQKRTMDILKQVGLDSRAKDYPWSLSGGQQQRVALARGLVMQPSVLLLDEPLSNLDVQLRQKMKEELTDIQKRTGVTVVYVTHDQAEALQMSHKIVVLNEGKIEQIGIPEDIYYRPETIFTANFVGKMNFIQRGDCTVGIRPENIRIDPAAEGVNDAAKKCLTGRLLRSIFEGNKIYYVFDSDKGELLLESAALIGIEEGKEAPLRWSDEVIFHESWTKNEVDV